MNIGMNLPFLTWQLALNVTNAFSIKCKDADGDLDLTGETVRLVVETSPAETTFNASIDGAYASWVLTAGQAVSDLVGRRVRLEVVSGGQTYLWARGRVISA